MNYDVVSTLTTFNQYLLKQFQNVKVGNKNCVALNLSSLRNFLEFSLQSFQWENPVSTIEKPEVGAAFPSPFHSSHKEAGIG